MKKFNGTIRLAFIAILLFCFIFVLAIPMRMGNERLADLILEEKLLESAVAAKQYELTLIKRSTDSLSSRNRIDIAAAQFGLGMNGVATKITRYSK
jgi:hypothetical protein